MGMESSSNRSCKSCLLATWRSTGMLTYIGTVSNSGMAMQLEIIIDIGDVVPSGDVPSSKLVSGDLSHISSPLLEISRNTWNLRVVNQVAQF